MRGSLKILPSRTGALSAVIGVLFLSLFAFGCGGSGGTERTASTEGSMKKALAESEKDFNPSKYNPTAESIVAQENSLFASLRSATVYTVAQQETIPGFRIQVMLSQEIGKAMAVRDTLTANYPDESVYVVYDAPTYKIRMGNYPDRGSAQSLLQRLARQGFTEAWIVPDNVLKNPPAKLPDHPIEPKNPFDNKR